MSKSKEFSLWFTKYPKTINESNEKYFVRLSRIPDINSTPYGIKRHYYDFMKDGGTGDFSSYEKRNNDGTVELKTIVEKKRTDEEIFERYGRSPLEWRIALVWFKDKIGGGYIMSCSFAPLKNVYGKLIEGMKEDLKKYAPKYKRVNYKKNHKNPVMLEISIYDLHYGKLCWGEESGQDYDSKIAENRFNSALTDIVSRAAAVYNIEKIVFVFGNDFFNSEGKSNATTAGTPQDTDSRWQKMFVNGRKLIVNGIEKLMAIAPVEAIGIYGNHANQAEFYLGDAIECWFHNCREVTVNNKPTARKYILYGNSLIGYTHGNLEKENELPLLMASEVPDMWAKARFREMHRGDKHHEREKVFNTTVENKSVVVRTLCSMSGTDAWHTGAGYVKQRQTTMGFVWGRESGLENIYYYNVL